MLAGELMSLPPYLSSRPDGVYLALKVQPRAPKNEIGHVLGSELKIKIAAPPVDSAANEGLIRFLAEWLGCPRNAVEIVHGHTSRHKQIRICGIPAEEVAERLGTNK